MSEVSSAAMEMPPPPPGRSAAVKALPRRRFFSDMPDKGLFVGVALLGFMVICWFKTHGHDADYISAFAVSLMLIYGIIAFQIPQVQMRLDRLGDNFYYLGFILTLASLSAALLQLRSQSKIEDLLGSFGIALVTTIVGIAGRVVFVQLRSEIDDVEEHVRRDLAAASADLRAQLFASIREFETFRTALQQTINETTEEFRKARTLQEGQTDAHARSAIQQLADASRDIHKELASVLREFEAFRTKLIKASTKHVEQAETLAATSADRVNAALETSRLQAQQMMEGLQTISQAADGIVKRLADIDLPGERLNEQMDRFTRELKALTGEIIGSAEEPRDSARDRWWPFSARRRSRR